MEYSADYFRSIVDSLTEHIVVIDNKGLIQYVNHAWIEFGISNECAITSEWQGVNYLDVCDACTQIGEKSGKHVADGIRKVIEGEHEVFYFEYPCHSNDEKRWFMMRVTPLEFHDANNYVISHHNITERKLAEEKIQKISNLDGLTELFNRRYFKEFLEHEWRRCERLKQPLSLIILDIDHFKLFNDHYGHLAGDDCLKNLAKVLKLFGKRPCDLSARYGGEEFAIILGNTHIKESTKIANAILHAIRELAIPHAPSSTFPVVTASFGVSMKYPRRDMDQTELIELADKYLYLAKGKGRNRVYAGSL